MPNINKRKMILFEELSYEYNIRGMRMSIYRKYLASMVVILCSLLVAVNTSIWFEEKPQMLPEQDIIVEKDNNQVDNVIISPSESPDIVNETEVEPEPDKTIKDDDPDKTEPTDSKYTPVKQVENKVEEKPKEEPANPQPKPVDNRDRLNPITDRGSFQHVIDDVPRAQILGIDISHHQSNRGEIEWEKVAESKVEFAFVKISEGSTYNDPYAKRHVVGAREVSIPTGGYHYARPAEPVNEDALAEVAHFINSLKLATEDYGDLPAVLDLEDPLYPGTNGLSTASLLTWAKTFCEEFEAITGHPIIIYTGNWFIDSWDNFNHPDNPLTDYKLWIADYYTNRQPSGGWESWFVWQFSDKGKIEGITGDVDLNIADKDLITYVDQAN